MLCAALGSFNSPKCVSIRAVGLVAVDIEQISRIQSVLLLQHIPDFLSVICYETCAVALIYNISKELTELSLKPPLKFGLIKLLVTVPGGNEDWSLQRFFSIVNATIFKIRAL